MVDRRAIEAIVGRARRGTARGAPLAARPALVRALREAVLVVLTAGVVSACLLQLGDRTAPALAATAPPPAAAPAGRAGRAFPVEVLVAESLVVRAPGSIEGIIAREFGVHVRAAIAVARCESGLHPDAITPGRGSWGLFQINRVHEDLVESMGYAWEDLLDARINARVAKVIHDAAGGWSPWECEWAAD